MEKLNPGLTKQDYGSMTTAVVPFSEGGKVYLTRPAIIKRIMDLIPEMSSSDSFGGRGEDSGNFLQQVSTFADLVGNIRDGKVEIESAMSTIGKPDSEKIQKATSIISQQLAIYVLAEPEDRAKFPYHWNRKMAELKDFLGRNRYKDILMATVNELPEPVWRLFTSVSSLNLMKDLGHIDIDECNEVRYGQYLRDAAFIRNESERTEVMGELIDVLEGRIDAGTIHSGIVMEYLSNLDYLELITDKLIESAKKNDQIDTLRVIFSSHQSTRHLSVKLSKGCADKETEPFTII